MDLTDYRSSSAEKEREESLVSLVPKMGRCALDIGARDGHFSLLIANRFENVIALDLKEPKISHPRIQCVKGNANDLEFIDNKFDFVLCAEVLEHVPASELSKICSEIERVANDKIVIGVPYKQDIRVGRTTCYSCGYKNPPWGHINSFDEDRIMNLFRSCKIESFSFIGKNKINTNLISVALMDFAGNPYGTYNQEEVCIHCGNPLIAPRYRSVVQCVATKFAFWSRKATEFFATQRANWMHIVLKKNS